MREQGDKEENGGQIINQNKGVVSVGKKAGKSIGVVLQHENHRQDKDQNFVHGLISSNNVEEEQDTFVYDFAFDDTFMEFPRIADEVEHEIVSLDPRPIDLQPGQVVRGEKISKVEANEGYEDNYAIDEDLLEFRRMVEVIEHEECVNETISVVQQLLMPRFDEKTVGGKDTQSTMRIVSKDDIKFVDETCLDDNAMSFMPRTLSFDGRDSNVDINLLAKARRDNDEEDEKASDEMFVYEGLK